MKPFRLTVAVLVVLAWALSAPLAMASNDCMLMSAICDGPCGASPCAVSVAPVMAMPTVITPAYTADTALIPDPPLHLLELPPK
jgi:hypothetical protein